MGLTSWEHDEIRRSDVEVAKNYLTEQELDALNKIVTAYLDIAEVHALHMARYFSNSVSALTSLPLSLEYDVLHGLLPNPDKQIRYDDKNICRIQSTQEKTCH